MLKNTWVAYYTNTWVIRFFRCDYHIVKFLFNSILYFYYIFPPLNAVIQGLFRIFFFYYIIFAKKVTYSMFNFSEKNKTKHIYLNMMLLLKLSISIVYSIYIYIHIFQNVRVFQNLNSFSHFVNVFK